MVNESIPVTDPIIQRSVVSATAVDKRRFYKF